MKSLKETRHLLHQMAELSGAEENTARYLKEVLSGLEGVTLQTGLGGHGVVATFTFENPGPTLLFRCDMDALPVLEAATLVPHASACPGVSHKCGHDGHMTILLGLARWLATGEISRGQVVLVFQPAEETGEGAAKILAEPPLSLLHVDYAFALHNLPGFPLGTVVLREGPFASASEGIVAHLAGVSSHAAEPQNGRSPAQAVASAISLVESLPQRMTGLSQNAKATLIHAIVGQEAFGTSPSQGAVMATLRAWEEPVLKRMEDTFKRELQGLATLHGLHVTFELREPFPATRNHPEATELVRQAAQRLGTPIKDPGAPFPWSEDFGHFTGRFKGTLFGVGSGVDHPALHNEKYDFPDEIIDGAVAVFRETVRLTLGE